MRYLPTIGLEIHVELKTKTKAFCGCAVEFGGEPNSRCCPGCTAFPGTLPVINRKAVEYAVKAGLALNCKINGYTKFDRKNYFYPDIPKAYQISQYDIPLCYDGYIDIDTSKGTKRIRIERIHLEEDAGKLVHDGLDRYSLADYNRCGVPLIEIVTKPDIESSEEAKAFVEKVRLYLMYAGVSDCRMEEGSMRVDVNTSIRPAGTDKLGTRTETKNLNSVRSIVRCIDNEIVRQASVLDSGGKILQETRRWDDDKGESTSMRSKENAQDYRYCPDIDIVPVSYTEQQINEIKASLPRMPHERFAQYTEQMSLDAADANQILASRALADLFESAANYSGNPKTTANFVIVEVLRWLNNLGIEPEQIPFDGVALGKLVKMQDNGEITANNAKKVLALMFETKDSPEKIAKDHGFTVITDTAQIKDTIAEVLKQNTKAVNEYLGGKEKAFGFLMGQCSRAFSGRANPQVIRQILQELLAEM